MNQMEKKLTKDFEKVRDTLLSVLNEEDWNNRPEKDQEENNNIYFHPVQTATSFFYAGYDIKKRKFVKLKYFIILNTKKWFHIFTGFKPGTQIKYINL